MNISMDDAIEQELRRLADEQGRDLVEVVETALRNYIVSETFAGDDVTDADFVDADRTGGGRAEGAGSAGVPLYADAAFPDLDEDAAFDADSVFSHLPPSETDSVVDGPFTADGTLDFDLDGLGSPPPAADSDTVIVGSSD